MSLIINLNAQYGSGGAASSRKPVLAFDGTPLPSLVAFTISGIGSSANAEVQVSQDSYFESFGAVEFIDGVATATNLGAGIWYFRGRGTDPDTQFSDVLNAVLVSQQLRSLTISANEGDGEVVITHNCTNDEPNVDYVSVKRRVTGSGAAMTEIDTFAPTTTAYTDATAVNDTSYEYRLDLIPDSLDYTISQSNIDEATPTAGTPTLSTPAGLTVTWDTETEGTGVFSWGAVSNATSYDVSLDGSFVANVATASRTFSGLIVGQLYVFSVKAKAAGYNDSATASVSRRPIDLDVTFLTPEEFGAVAYMKPLDGRLVDGQPFPLIGLEEIGISEFNSLSTGLTYGDYPNGVSKVTTVNDVGAPVLGVFTSEDVGMSFVALKSNLNGASGESVDEYIPYDIGARYATVIWQDKDFCLVDFGYNIEADNLLGYIFSDASEGLTACFAAARDAGANAEVRVSEYERTGYALSCYVAPQLLTTSGITGSNNIHITTVSGIGRIKFGVEDYYKFIPTGGATFYQQANALFTFVGYTGQFTTHNVEICPPHCIFAAAEPFERYLAGGTLGGNGVVFFINTNSFSEYNEIENGYGAPDYILPTISFHKITASGTYAGTGALTDVDKFAFIAAKGCHFAGPFAAGQAGGSTRGGEFEFLQDFVVDYEDQNKYAPSTQTFTARVTTDYSTLAAGADTDYLPACMEITSTDGNWLKTRTQGGGNRTSIVHVGKFIFLSNIPRFNQLNLFNQMYSYGYTPFATDGDGVNTVTAKKMLFDWDIVTETESDNITPKYITLCREYRSNAYEDNPATANSGFQYQMRGFNRNAFRTHINWAVALEYMYDELTNDHLVYINAKDRRPKGWQVNDSFKVCAWVDVDNVAGWSEGDTITGAGQTGTVREIDTHHFVNRLMIGSATGSFDAATTVTNGTITASVTDASMYDPTEIYTIIRKQRGQFMPTSAIVTTWLDSESVTGTITAGTTVTGGTSGATATVDGPSDSVVVRAAIKLTNVVGNFQAGETVTASNGATFVIPANTAFKNVSDNFIPNFTATGEAGSRAGMIKRAADGSNSCYYYETCILDKDLPLGINGNDDADPLFHVEVVNSEAAILLDYANRTVRHTYKDSAGWGENYHTTDLRNRRQTTGTLANGYGDTGAQSPLSSFDGAAWVYTSDPAGHLLYTVGEITRMWYDGDARNGYARINGTSGGTANTLGRYSKGWFIKDVINPPTGQWVLAGDAASIRRQFETTRTIYEANPSYVAGWATDEGLPNQPRVHLYGSNSGDQMNWTDTTLTNVVRDANAANAPALPSTLQTILTTLGE